MIATFVEVQLKRENLKVFWVSEFGFSNQYTAFPNGLDKSLGTHFIFQTGI